MTPVLNLVLYPSLKYKTSALALGKGTPLVPYPWPRVQDQCFIPDLEYKAGFLTLA
jgi:hypothetical protein